MTFPVIGNENGTPKLTRCPSLLQERAVVFLSPRDHSSKFPQFFILHKISF